jgi:hypothetical protein
MNFSLIQWLTFCLLDFLLKAACFYLIVGAVMLTVPSISLLIPMAFTATIIHVIFLGIGNGLTSFVKTMHRARFAITLLVAEGLLVASVLFCFFYSLSESSTRCPGTQMSCPEVASRVWLEAALLGTSLLVINLLPVVVVLVVGALARFVGPSPQKVERRLLP